MSGYWLLVTGWVVTVLTYLEGIGASLNRFEVSFRLDPGAGFKYS